MTSLVSVIIPCYNAVLYVEKAVRSIMNQSYKNLEIIVIDDGSIDGSTEILKKLSKEDKRIIYIRNEINIKLIATLNKGIKLSRGKYIARMDADDISHKTRIEEQVLFFQKNPNVFILGTAINSFRKEGMGYKYVPQPKDDLEIKLKLLVYSTFHHPTVMFNTSVLNKNRIKYDNLYYRLEDYALWVDLMLNENVQYANLKKPLLDYRLLENSESKESNKNLQSKNITMKAIILKILLASGIKMTEEELDNYIFSLNRANFGNINLRLLNLAFNKILENEDFTPLKALLTKRWLGVLYLGDKKKLIREINMVLLSRYTWLGGYYYIKSKIIK